MDKNIESFIINLYKKDGLTIKKITELLSNKFLDEKFYPVKIIRVLKRNGILEKAKTSHKADKKIIDKKANDIVENSLIEKKVAKFKSIWNSLCAKQQQEILLFLKARKCENATNKSFTSGKCCINVIFEDFKYFIPITSNEKSFFSLVKSKAKEYINNSEKEKRYTTGIDLASKNSETTTVIIRNYDIDSTIDKNSILNKIKCTSGNPIELYCIKGNLYE
jgi:di/tripeptidase